MNCIAQVGWVSLAVITLAAIGASAIAGWLAGVCMKMMDAADLRDEWRTINSAFYRKDLQRERALRKQAVRDAFDDALRNKEKE